MINVAIIGIGNIALARHIPGILTFPERAKIVALVDIYPEKAEAAKKQFGLEDAVVFDNHKKMLESGIKIDAVHVCVPPSAHAEISIDCMDAGLNVLCEKPMAPSLKECDAMLEAEKRNNVTFGSVAQNRFTNIIYKLKKVAETGLAGPICVAHVDSLWWRGHCYYDLWWRGTWEKEGGGPTLNHAVHHIDIINWIKGELPVEVSAMLANVAHDNSEVEDISFAALKYADGTIAEVTSSVVHHGEEQGVILQCKDAKIAAPWSCVADVTMDNGFPVDGHNQKLMDELNAVHDSIEDLKYESHTAEIDNYYHALETNTRPMITGIDGRKTVELITAMYKAGFEKRTVTLPITEDDEYYTVDGIQKNAIHFHKKTSFVENFATNTITVGSFEEKKEQ